MKKRLMAAALILIMLFGIAGCTAMKAGNGSGNTRLSGEKVQLTMYLWDKSMTRELTPWLEKQFPDIQFTFVVGYNTMAYYEYLNERDKMPDIITCRRFSLNDAASLADELMDLSRTEVAGSFYESYLENNREMDGAIRWLPMCAEVDGFFANVDLFEQYDIPLPTNYAEFVEASARFEEVGVPFFMTDWKSDYTCLEIMQGCAIPELMSLEGTTWRRAYESEMPENPVGLDDKVWPVVFDKFAQFLQDLKVKPEDLENRFVDAATPFKNGELAIMRGTANDCAVTKKENGINCVMLPYFGEESKDNWILTYPMCQLAVSKSVEQDPVKLEATLRVLEAIFSTEGQGHLASGASVLSYNKNIDLGMGDVLSVIMDCVDRNHMYMRLASTEIFSISKDVVHKMVKGEYGPDFAPQAAYEDFNAQLIRSSEPTEEEIVITQKESYPYTYGEHGSPAASSLMNTVRAGSGDDIAIGYANVVACPVYAGDYTEQQLKWFMAFKSIAYRGEYTGSEIRRIMEWLVNIKEDGSNPIRHYNVSPVTSGMEYTMTDNGDGTYTLGELTIHGQPLENDRVYHVLLMGEDNYIENEVYCNCPMPEDLRQRRERQNTGDYNSYQIMLDSLAETGQFLPPTEYLTILS